MTTRLVLLVCIVLAAAARGQDAQGNVIGEVFSGEAGVQGSLLRASGGMQVLSGSQVSAGDGAALVKLRRGGEVRVCPKTNLATSADSAGKSLVLGLSVGSMELHYTLSRGADLLMTPDLRLQLISPGTFHLAISVGPTGDTCIRSMADSDASVFVTEMMGSAGYQIGAGKSVMFGSGRIAEATMAPPWCGCPPADLLVASKDSGTATTMSADEAATSTQAPEKKKTMEAAAAEYAQAHAVPDSRPGARGTGAAPSKMAHLESESKFVYRGDHEAQDLYASVSTLSLSTDNSGLVLALLPTVTGPEAVPEPPPAPPAAAKKQAHGRGFWGSIGHFFGRVFRPGSSDR
jgi:hypothetical protein